VAVPLIIYIFVTFFDRGIPIFLVISPPIPLNVPERQTPLHLMVSVVVSLSPSTLPAALGDEVQKQEKEEDRRPTAPAAPAAKAGAEKHLKEKRGNKLSFMRY
jgi:hypothetical protein